jgi:hydroxyacylglutathione hydrolase
MYIEQLYTNCLAEVAYYIESEGEAAYENVPGYLAGGIDAWDSEREFIQSVWPEAMRNGVDILDTRKPGEWNSSPANLAGLDKNKTYSYYVHCAGGYRSMIACSIMKREGFIHPINVYGGFAAMEKAGMAVVAEDVHM